VTPLPPLKNLQGASASSEVMSLTYQDHSLRERPGLGTMKHTKPKTQESSSKNVSGPVTVCDTEPVTSSISTKVKNNGQESKIDELTKLVQMLMDVKINSTQKIQEFKLVNLQSESSKPVNSSKIRQESKPNGKNTDSSKSVRPKPLQKPKLKCELYHYTNHSTNDYYRILYYMKYKREDHRTSNHNMYVASLKSSENYKAQPCQYASHSKPILIAKAKPYPPCTHCGFNDHRLDDCQNYLECATCGSYDHFTSGHNRVILIRGGVLAESFQSSESSIGVSCTTCGSNVHSTTDHNDFQHFKRGTIFNANKEIMLIAPRRNDVYVLDMSSLTPNGACFFAKALESVNWLWHKRLLRLNFKKINKLAKQNKVLGLPSLTNVHNHEKYTIVIVDEYSRYTWVHFLRKKSRAAEMIMAFIRMAKNQDDVKVKQLRTDNGTEFRNSELESFCDEK
ncbi:retrovirus-related pol polyprotein from transposon TNT 1-94, partial [Tanacetum coccineum]